MPWDKRPTSGNICKVCRRRNDCDGLDCTQSGVKNMSKTGDLWEPSGWTCDHCGNHENDKMPVEGKGKNKGKTYGEFCYKLFVEKKNPNKLGDFCFPSSVKAYLQPSKDAYDVEYGIEIHECGRCGMPNIVGFLSESTKSGSYTTYLRHECSFCNNQITRED